jgi:hypothetical protein
MRTTRCCLGLLHLPQKAKETWRSSQRPWMWSSHRHTRGWHSMGPHLLMRGLPTSPNEPAGICSHGEGRGLRPPPEESDSSSATPVATIASSAKRSVSVCREEAVGNVPEGNAPAAYFIKSGKVPAEALGWSLALGREGLSGLSNDKHPARSGFGEAG